MSAFELFFLVVIAYYSSRLFGTKFGLTPRWWLGSAVIVVVAIVFVYGNPLQEYPTTILVIPAYFIVGPIIYWVEKYIWSKADRSS